MTCLFRQLKTAFSLDLDRFILDGYSFCLFKISKGDDRSISFACQGLFYDFNGIMSSPIVRYGSAHYFLIKTFEWRENLT